MFFNRMKNIDVVEICSCFDTLLHLISMIAYKTLSTLFPYLIALLTLEMLMKYFYDFSAVDIPSMDHITCHTNMWRNIFYIDQFYPLEERVSLYIFESMNKIFRKCPEYLYEIYRILPFFRFFANRPVVELTVHGLVVDIIDGGTMLRYIQYYSVDLEKSSTVWHYNIRVVLHNGTCNGNDSPVSRSTAGCRNKCRVSSNSHKKFLFFE